MKTTSLIKSLLLTCAVGIFAGTAHADEKTDAAVGAAKEWLALVDSKEYKKKLAGGRALLQRACK